MLLDHLIDLKLEEVTEASRLEALAPEWLPLWRRCPEATPFQSPMWLLPWWRAFGQGALHVLALRLAGQLVGLAPFYVYPEPYTGVRKLLLLGSGNSDYLDVVLEPGIEARAMTMIHEHLATLHTAWDVAEFMALREGSPLLQSSRMEWRELTVERGICPVLELRGVAGVGLPGVPSRKLKQRRYYQRRADQAGANRTELASRKNFELFFDAFIRLHGTRWRQRGEAGVLAGAEVVRFHRESAFAMLEQGVLRLYAFWLGHEIVASLYGFTAHERFCLYLGGFDPRYSALSPGTLLIGQAIRDAAQDGCQYFDFLNGEEDYKFSWGARPTRTFLRRMW